MHYLFILFLFLSAPVFADLSKEGLDYQKITTEKSQIVHILNIDPSKFQIILRHAKNQAKGVETLETLAQEHQALAAINAGFFHMEDDMKGLPAGILKIDDRWYGIAYTNRAAIGWSNHENQVLIDRIQTKTSIKIKRQRFPLHAVNQPAAKERATLYTPAFGETVETPLDSQNFVIQNNKIIAMLPGGQIKIPQNGFVYSMGAKLAKKSFTPSLHDEVEIHFQILPEIQANQKYWEKFNNIVGGTPLLISQDKILLDPSQKRMKSPFAAKQRARTALGILKNGHWVFVVVEKSSEPLSVGMSLMELAHFMKQLGCQQAINLDGGGSSGLYLNNKMQNLPEEKEDDSLSSLMYRSIADGILVLEKK